MPRRSFLAAAGLPFVCGCKKAPVPRIAAASDLVLVLPLILDSFPGDGPRAIVTYGSTGKLAQQIENGAPYDVFFAAHERYLVDLEAKGLVLPGSRKVFAHGLLAVVGQPGCKQGTTLTDLADPRFKRIAIANPDHAPYGTAAQEALVKAGVFSSVGPRLVLADNVQTALAFVRTGNADAAIAARSLLATDEPCVTAVDPGLHAPIAQAAAVLRTAAEPIRAQQLIHWLVEEKVQALLARSGFARPGPP